MSVLLTLSTFGGASLYSMSQPIGKFNSWGPVLFGSLCGVIGL